VRDVSLFEAKLIRILRSFFGQYPLPKGLTLLAQTTQQPKCLSRNAVELIKNTLQAGLVEMLARGGGRSEIFLKLAEPRSGRIWERHSPEQLRLTFSQASLRFLIWATASDVSTARPTWFVSENELTTGDRLLMFVCLRAVHGAQLAGALCQHKPFRQNALCRLSFPENFVNERRTLSPNIAIWFRNDSSFVLEALQVYFADRWFELESNKSRLTDPPQVARLGQEQRAILTAFLDEAEKTNRRDLARFMLVALRWLIDDKPNLQDWIGRLNVSGMRVADRLQVYEHCFVLPHCIERLGDWNRSASGVGYFDDGYQAAKFWKSTWETAEGELLQRAVRRLTNQFQPL
jgi:hypothetical protein